MGVGQRSFLLLVDHGIVLDVILQLVEVLIEVSHLVPGSQVGGADGLRDLGDRDGKHGVNSGEQGDLVADGDEDRLVGALGDLDSGSPFSLGFPNELNIVPILSEIVLAVLLHPLLREPIHIEESLPTPHSRCVQ